MKCPDCGSENIVKEEEIYCGNCGLILLEDCFRDDNYKTDNYPLNDSVEMNVTLARLERKHGYTSKAQKRFWKFKSDYWDLFEKILLEEGYKYADIPHIFYNHFMDYYYSRKQKKGSRKRKDIIYDFLISWEI